MTATATLTVRDAEYGAGWRIIAIDCAHGTTTSLYRNGDDAGAVQLSDAAIVRATVARHYLAERCRCTRKLRTRYGLG